MVKIFTNVQIKEVHVSKNHNSWYCLQLKLCKNLLKCKYFVRNFHLNNWNGKCEISTIIQWIFFDEEMDQILKHFLVEYMHMFVVHICVYGNKNSRMQTTEEFFPTKRFFTKKKKLNNFLSLMSCNVNYCGNRGTLNTLKSTKSKIVKIVYVRELI